MPEDIKINKSKSKQSIHTLTNRIFLRGLTTLLPALLTVLILVKSYQFIDESLATPINLGLAKLVAHVKDVPLSEMNPLPQVIGFVIAFSLFFFAGLLFAGFVGRHVFQILETWVSSLPIIKAVYPHARQIVDFFTAEKRPKVSGVVFVEYPRKGLYSLGFITGSGLKDINSIAGGEEVINIFIPSSPTPISGYAVFLPRKHIHPINMTVDEVLRYTVSAGVLIPDHQKRG